MEFSFKIEVNAAKEKIWDYYADIKKWFVWEGDLEDISLDGGFVEGTIGIMKLSGMPAMQYTLSKVIANKEFWDKTETPMGSVCFGHQILEEANGVFIQHIVRLDSTEITSEKIDFLKQIFSDVPDSILLLKKEVEK